jgi:RimJ/RimL family protein N-acetyltransferase
MIVTLDVPDCFIYQIFNRMERSVPYEVMLDAGSTFLFLASSTAWLPWQRELRQSLGFFGMCKSAAKLATGVRHLYAVVRDGRVLSYGWGTVGRCQYYEIERQAVVIGPIWSDPDVRGKGIATAALLLAVNEYMRRGRTQFYIDTAKHNLPAQRVFHKCGFGEPVALYFRQFT